MDLWLDGVEHSSPIRIERITPLGTGKSEVEVAFFHLCYPEGVKDKTYRLKVLHRSRDDILAVRMDADDHRTLRLAPLTRAWLARQSGVPSLLALATGDDDDFAAQLDSIVRGDAPPELTIPFYLPWEIEETMLNCALRFDGYAWLDAAKPQRELEMLAPANEKLLRDLTLDPDPDVNFAAFFFLQRFLGKWGGETLPPSDRHHTAYRFLFLHLHTTPTPARWMHEEYEAKWNNTPGERIVIHAAAVRRMLLAAFLRSEIANFVPPGA